MILDNLYLNESLGFTENEIFQEDICFALEDIGALNEETNLMTPLTLIKEAFTGNSKKRLQQLENSYKTMETRGDKKRLLGRIRRSIAAANTALDQSFYGQVEKYFSGAFSAGVIGGVAKLFLQNNKKCIAATKEYRTKLLELEKKVLAKKVDGETKDNLVESFDILDLF